MDVKGSLLTCNKFCVTICYKCFLEKGVSMVVRKKGFQNYYCHLVILREIKDYPSSSVIPKVEWEED